VVTRRSYRLRSRSSRRGLTRRLRRRVLAIASTGHERKCSKQRKQEAGTARVHHTFNLAADRRQNEGRRGEGAA
jgi:hypothetical protein